MNIIFNITNQHSYLERLSKAHKKIFFFDFLYEHELKKDLKLILDEYKNQVRDIQFWQLESFLVVRNNSLNYLEREISRLRNKNELRKKNSFYFLFQVFNFRLDILPFLIELYNEIRIIDPLFDQDFVKAEKSEKVKISDKILMFDELGLLEFLKQTKTFENKNCNNLSLIIAYLTNENKTSIDPVLRAFINKDICDTKYPKPSKSFQKQLAKIKSKGRHQKK